MSQQNGGLPDAQQPWQDQESTSANPHVFPFGGQSQSQPQDPAEQQGSQPMGQGMPQAGSQPQQWGQPQGHAQYGQAEQQWGSVPQSPTFGQQSHGAPNAQWGQPEPFGSGPQHPAPQQGQPLGSQGYPQNNAASEQWSDPQQQGNPSQGLPQQQPSQGQNGQQFSGILDPHTGEIHPVPDLQHLDETDALLVVVSGPDAGAQILLDTDVVTVGRSPNADIFLDDVTVSRKHAEFVRTPSGFTLRDTGSLNGTYVGRQLIDSIELQNGADVQIGKFRMIFQQRPRTS